MTDSKNRVNYKSSAQKYFCLFPSFFSSHCIFSKRWILAETTVVIIPQYMYIKLSCLNTYSDMCIFVLNKSEKVIKELPYSIAIPLLGIYLMEMNTLC